jgi:phytanoyl-CoA hydroxylase
MRQISDAQWAQYHRDGYLRLGSVLDGANLAALQTRIDDIMMGRVPFDGYMQLDQGGEYAALDWKSSSWTGPTLSYRKIQDLERDDLFLAYMQRALFREICADVYGAHAAISCFRAMFMNKPARKGTFLPWHQDGGASWELDRDPLVTVWTALDPATTANGCVQVVPGSHRFGILSEDGHVISDEHRRQHVDAGQVVHLELAPGEAVLLHNWLLHASDVNRTDVSRRAFSVCYIDARTRHRDGKSFPVIFGKDALVPQASSALAAGR